MSKEQEAAKAAAEAANKEAEACLKAAMNHPQLKGKSQAAITKAAIFRFIREALGVKADAPEAAEAFASFMATKAAFGASANTLTDGFGLLDKNGRTVQEFTGSI